MLVRPQLYTELRIGAKILSCENCRRLLYYAEPAADVEAQMNN